MSFRTKQHVSLMSGKNSNAESLTAHQNILENNENDEQVVDPSSEEPVDAKTLTNLWVKKQPNTGKIEENSVLKEIKISLRSSLNFEIARFCVEQKKIELASVCLSTLKEKDIKYQAILHQIEFMECNGEET